MRHVTARHSDDLPPGFWDPPNAMSAIERTLVYMLIHPRNWRANRRANVRDDLRRVREGVAYSLAVPWRRRTDPDAVAQDPARPAAGEPLTAPRAPGSPVAPDGAIVHAGVVLGPGAQVGAFAVLGEPPGGRRPGEDELRIGANALIRSHTVMYAGSQVGDNFQSGHGVLVREATTIGNDVSIGSHTVIEHHVTIGDRVRIQSDAFIPEFSVLEEGSWVGPNAVFTNARYPLSPSVKDELAGPVVRAAAKIGANVTLLPGVVIGRNALVGAGSVVTHDVADDAIVVGNPARQVGSTTDTPAYAQMPQPKPRSTSARPAR